MSPVWMRATAELRAHWRAWVGLVLVIGLTGVVVLDLKGVV